jgi:hypothetical protein
MVIDTARKILEAHGAKKVERPDLEVWCDVYEFDQREVAELTLKRELEKAGFEYANSGCAEYFNSIGGGKALATPSADIRDVVSREDGSVGYDESTEADEKVIRAMLEGRVVFQSADEKQRVLAAAEKRGMFSCPISSDRIMRMARERECIWSGKAIMMSPSDAPKLYFLITERQVGRG